VALYRPLGSLANRQGRTLANILAGRPDSFPAVAGAMAVKAFDLQVAAVGTSETAARARGLAIRSAWITIQDRADYWPESKTIHLKMVYDPGSQRVLGVQGVGEGDVMRRIDVATQLILRGATLTDFTRLEHAYAPPFASALDPLAVLACVAQNQEDGIEADSPLSALGEVIDVRLPEERAERPVPAANVHEVALSSLRSNGEETLRGTVVCERGGRAAETVRLLHTSGSPARYLGGGLIWRTRAGVRS
jgi:rhodanese-related sulfurtransferase